MENLLYFIASFATTEGLETSSLCIVEPPITGESVPLGTYHPLPPKPIYRNACAFNHKTQNMHIVGTDGESSIYHLPLTLGETNPSDWDSVTPTVIQFGKPDPLPTISGNISSCIDLKSMIHVFVVNDKKELLHLGAPIRPAGTTLFETVNWTANPVWDFVPGPDGASLNSQSSMATATDSLGNLHLFVIDTSNTLWHTKVVTDPDEPILLQTSWESVAGVISLGSGIAGFKSIACTETDMGSLLLCATDKLSRLYYNYYDNVNGFETWRDVGAGSGPYPNAKTPEKVFFYGVTCSTGKDGLLHIAANAILDSVQHTILYTYVGGDLISNPQYKGFQDIQGIEQQAFPGKPVSISLVEF